MNYYKTIRKSVEKMRVVTACILFATGLIILACNIKDVYAYMKGPVNLSGNNVEDRYLKQHDGEFVTVTVTDITGYTNGYDGAQKDNMYGIVPAKKSGWIAGYKGCIQYCEIISYGKYNKEFVKAYKELLEYDEGGSEKPDVSITVKGRVVKRSGIWKDYFEKYAGELVDAGAYDSISQVQDNTGGEYMIDMSEAVPVINMVMVIAGIIIMFAGIYVYVCYLVCSGYEDVSNYIAKLDRVFTPDDIKQDYLNGKRYGTTVIGEKFLYYVKGQKVRMLYLPQINEISRKKHIFTSTIVINTVYGKVIKYKVNVRYGKKIVKVIRAYLQELLEFGMEE